MASIQGIYIALFGRPADPLGLDYFNSITDNGQDLGEIGNLAGQPEYLSRFEGMNNTQIVTSIYQELFGRNPDAAGLAFFTTQLNSGAQNINTIAINILDGARGEDAALVAAKIAAADQFTAAVRADPDALAAYQGQSGINFGQQFLDQIDSSDDKLTNAQVTEQVGGFGDTGGNSGDTFTLTAGIDNLDGTAGADTFQAIVDAAGAATTTINTFDNINGGAGVDTLNIVGAGGGVINENATISGIEVVNIATDAAITDLNSDSFDGVEQIWQVGVNGDITVDDGVVAGFRNGTLAGDVTAADGATSVAVALDNVDAAGTVTVGEETAGDLTTVNVSGNVADDGALTIASTATEVTALNVSLTSDVALTLTGFDELVTLNATGSTGNVGVNLGTPEALTSATFGAGGDTVTLDTSELTGSTLAINLGAGNDTIVLTADSNDAATAVTITLGAGSDSVQIDGLTNITATNAVAADLVTVADFNAAQDVLDLSGLGLDRDVLINNELSNIEDATTLDAALTLAAQYTADGQYSVFDYNGDAYVYANNDGAAFGAGDGLVKVVGFSVDQITGSNFVGDPATT